MSNPYISHRGTQTRRTSRAKEPARMRGLGDLVGKVLEKVGIRKRGGCGCGRRQKTLNRLFPFKSKLA